jgi:hypothetical protein
VYCDGGADGGDQDGGDQDGGDVDGGAPPHCEGDGGTDGAGDAG